MKSLIKLGYYSSRIMEQNIGTTIHVYKRYVTKLQKNTFTNMINTKVVSNVNLVSNYNDEP